MNIKECLYSQCVDFVENRFQAIQNTIKEIQESLTSETKSSAGDKHETGRAMLQLEREKAGNQLAEIQKIQAQLSKISLANTSEVIGLGSAVYTNKSNYFIAISAGELKIENDIFYAISSNTPIGQLLIGKTVGDEVIFREQKFKIEKFF
ncbi:3-oxoacyl-ACP synthase [Mariniflexile jejuense]|uniref:3-oxoacyl-ACP synthase n=1 Tax=Mariniflexile jejuense TaxID=1173582 RepID=A0ABW3JJI4_9FLAO